MMKNIFISNLKAQALEQKIPIIQDEGLDFLLNLIKENNIVNILEIGSAIGYSAIQMAQLNTKVITIERDYFMYNELLKNIEKSGLTDQIFPILGDALEVEVEGKFDLIFIDAAKAQYMKFFEKFKQNLAPSGMIVCDNIDFHHLKQDEVSRNTRQLLRKLEKFIKFLENNDEFETKIYHLGDGLSVSKRMIDWNI